MSTQTLIEEIVELVESTMKLGGGGRFKALTKKLSHKGVRDPKAVAAAIGRKKLGKKKFQALAATGERRALRKR
jgi:hypothetical protein